MKRVTRLNDLEKLIMCCLIYGDTDKQIAARIGTDINKVRGYNKTLFRKLVVTNRTEAAMLGWQHLLATDTPPNRHTLADYLLMRRWA